MIQYVKKLITTRERRAEHPFAGRNTQQAGHRDLQVLIEFAFIKLSYILYFGHKLKFV